MAKSLLIISRQAPWAGPAAREALERFQAVEPKENPRAELLARARG